MLLKKTVTKHHQSKYPTLYAPAKSSMEEKYVVRSRPDPSRFYRLDHFGLLCRDSKNYQFRPEVVLEVSTSVKASYGYISFNLRQRSNADVRTLFLDSPQPAAKRAAAAIHACIVVALALQATSNAVVSTWLNFEVRI